MPLPTGPTNLLGRENVGDFQPRPPLPLLQPRRPAAGRGFGRGNYQAGRAPLQPVRGYQGQDMDHGYGRGPNVKLEVQPFGGTTDAEAYLEWEHKTEQVFDFYQYTDAQKVAIATIKFIDFAYHWWIEDKEEREYNGYPPIDTWDELKTALRHRFVPEDFTARLHSRLEQLRQGTKTPDEYYKELKILIYRSGLRFPEGYVISKFINCLNPDLKAIVSKQHFVRGTTIEEILHYTNHIYENLPQRKSYSSNNRPWNNQGGGSSSYPTRRPESKQDAPAVPTRREPSRTPQGGRREGEQRSSEIKCFKCLGRGHMAKDCPSRRQVLLNTIGEYESDEEAEVEEPQEEEEEVAELQVEAETHGECFVVKRSLITNEAPTPTKPKRNHLPYKMPHPR